MVEPDLHVGLAELDLGADDLVGAAARLETARVLRERASITENRHRWFVASACRQAGGWKWAAAEPATERWGSLQ